MKKAARSFSVSNSYTDKYRVKHLMTFAGGKIKKPDTYKFTLWIETKTSQKGHDQAFELTLDQNQTLTLIADLVENYEAMNDTKLTMKKVRKALKKHRK